MPRNRSSKRIGPATRRPPAEILRSVIPAGAWLIVAGLIAGGALGAVAGAQTLSSKESPERLQNLSNRFLQELERPDSGVVGLPGEKVVYRSDFFRGASEQWSHRETASTPSDGRGFLGPLRTDNVTLLLRRLPRHELLVVSFDLYIVGSWDGNSSSYGPDRWSLSLFRGRRLIDATFNNDTPFSGDQQTYPDSFPCPPHPARTGVSEASTLGYAGFGRPSFDSVYSVQVAFPHSERQVGLRFAGDFLDKAVEQFWGLADVVVRAVPQQPTLSEEELQQFWEELGGDDAVAANAALWRLVAAGDQATDLIRKSLALETPEAPEDAAKNPSEQAWRIRRSRRVLHIIDTPEARQALWRLGDRQRFDTRDDRHFRWSPR